MTIRMKNVMSIEKDQFCPIRCFILENMDAEDGGVGEGGDVVRVDDGGAGDAVVRGPRGIDGGVLVVLL